MQIQKKGIKGELENGENSFIRLPNEIIKELEEYDEKIKNENLKMIENGLSPKWIKEKQNSIQWTLNKNN
jgi:hypothetical protein